MRFSTLSMVAASIASTFTTSANAQNIPNLISNTLVDTMNRAQLSACRAGTTVLSDKLNREATEAAQALMGRYWNAVRASNDATIDNLYIKSGLWVREGSTIRVHANRITDPIARAETNLLAAEPVALLPGRYGRSARGVWEVKTSSGERAGYYLVDFFQTGEWRIARLELLSANASFPEIKPFCQVPGDIDEFHKKAADIPERRIADLVKKSKPTATCLQGSDCLEKWLRAREWVKEHSILPLIRDTDRLVVTSPPLRGSLTSSYAVVLDPPASDGRRTIRLRVWCGNWFSCDRSESSERAAFLTALQATSVTGQGSQ